MEQAEWNEVVEEFELRRDPDHAGGVGNVLVGGEGAALTRSGRVLEPLVLKDIGEYDRAWEFAD